MERGDYDDNAPFNEKGEVKEKDFKNWYAHWVLEECDEPISEIEFLMQNLSEEAYGIIKKSLESKF